MLKTKMVRDGDALVETAHSNRRKRVACFEEGLEDTIVVKKAFLQEICDEWNKKRGEVRLANFLLGGTDDEGNKDYSLQRTQEELERKI